MRSKTFKTSNRDKRDRERERKKKRKTQITVDQLQTQNKTIVFGPRIRHTQVQDKVYLRTITTDKGERMLQKHEGGK